MILMWLGSFALMLYGLSESRNALANLFSSLFKNLDSKSAIANSVLLEASPQKSLYSGMALYNLRVLDGTSSVFMMCLSSLGAWWVFLLAFLFMKINGLVALGLAAILFLSFLPAKVSSLRKGLIAVGIFLLGGEMMLRQSSMLSLMMGESNLAFFMADGRFGAVLVLFLLAAVLSAFVEIEFWSLVLGMALLISNTVSLNGALALFAGERVGRVLLFWWRTQKLNQACRHLGKFFGWVSSSGAVLGLFVAGAIRESSSWGYSSGMISVQDKLSFYLVLCLVICLFQFASQMVWGHFASRIKVVDLQEAKYFPTFWLERKLLADSVRVWARGKVHQRISEIRYHQQGLNTVKAGQIPEIMQNRLRDEEQQLAALAKALI